MNRYTANYAEALRRIGVLLTQVSYCVQKKLEQSPEYAPSPGKAQKFNAQVAQYITRLNQPNYTREQYNQAVSQLKSALKDWFDADAISYLSCDGVSCNPDSLTEHFAAPLPIEKPGDPIIGLP